MMVLSYLAVAGLSGIVCIVLAYSRGWENGFAEGVRKGSKPDPEWKRNLMDYADRGPRQGLMTPIKGDPVEDKYRNGPIYQGDTYDLVEPHPGHLKCDDSCFYHRKGTTT
jgi:hypothetical protein